jgi:serine/threonine-protein kinase RsbW
MGMQEACFDRRLYSRKINSDAVAVCREVNVVLDRIDHLSHLSEDDQFDVKVILCELLQNAIRHGNAMDRAKMIALDVTLDDQDTLEISVQDEGSGFDMESVLAQKRDKRIEAEDVFDLDEFGRGLLIIESLCDTVCRNDRGNRITIRKQMQHA